MSDIVYCNKKQAEEILKKYFSIPPVITRVSKNSEDGLYFIEALTVPGYNRTEWQYRPWNNIGACFGEVHKGNRRYDLNGVYPNELMSTINKTFRQAIDRYERGCDIFQNETTQEIKGFFKSIIYNLTKSNKRGYIWTIIVLIILLIFILTK